MLIKKPYYRVLLRDIPAVNRQRMASNERGCFGTQPYHSLGDFFWFADATNRVSRNHSFGCAGMTICQPLDHWGVDPVGDVHFRRQRGKRYERWRGRENQRA